MRIIDLSMPLHSGMKVYPGDPTVQIDIKHTHAQEGWELRQLTMGTHTGTHVDAFSHMHSDKASIDQIPLHRFFGLAQLVKRTDDWPNQMGLLFKEKIDMTDYPKIVASQPNFVGGEMSEALERALLEATIITYTDLINLKELPLRTTFTFYGIPLNICEGDGSPVRAFVILD